ncbi:unnamed protein product, partial [marine sediment metagenome]
FNSSAIVSESAKNRYKRDKMTKSKQYRGILMKAIVYTKYGPPDVLQLKEVAKPAPKDNEVLVRIYATTVNRTDCATIRAIPFFARLLTGMFKPKKQTPGTEFAGKIEEIGKNVKSLKVGDKVFGFDDQGSGSHAQYMTIPEDKALTTIPKNITYEQAAASTEGAHYAYNFIKKVNLKSGQKVLVYICFWQTRKRLQMN